MGLSGRGQRDHRGLESRPRFFDEGDAEVGRIEP